MLGEPSQYARLHAVEMFKTHTQPSNELDAMTNCSISRKIVDIVDWVHMYTYMLEGPPCTM